MLMPPSSRAAVWTKCWMESAFRVSQTMGTTLWPDSCASSAAACFSGPSVRAQMATSQPSIASWRAIARPMPRLAPVTMAFLPVSCRSTGSSFVRALEMRVKPAAPLLLRKKRRLLYYVLSPRCREGSQDLLCRNGQCINAYPDGIGNGIRDGGSGRYVGELADALHV